MRTYANRWIPEGVTKALAQEPGRVLDVGGGAAPWFRASHILDIQPFDRQRLIDNCWGREAEAPARGWTEAEYTRLDLCGTDPWPFVDGAFDVGLCSHCLEDLRDPLAVLRELGRVCRRVWIIAPSRLLEQCRGIDHPRYCGFAHHLWMITVENGGLVFRRKTPVVELPGCHLVVPFGRTLRCEDGTVVYRGYPPRAEERVFWGEDADRDEYRTYLQPYRARRDLFVRDPTRRGWRQQLWWLRRRWGGGTA